MTVQADLVKPRRMLMEDRFSTNGDLMNVGLADDAALVHLATEGCGTATALLDHTSVLSVARAMLKANLALDPTEPEGWRVRAALELLHGGWITDDDGGPF